MVVVALGWASPMVDRPLEILVVEVDGQRVGVPTEMARELVRAAALTTAPAQSTEERSLVTGLLNLRGQAVPIVDARRWLGWASRSLEPSDHFLIVGRGPRLVGIWIDRPLEISTATVPTNASVGAANVAAVPLGDGLVLLPNVDGLLNSVGSEGGTP